VIAVVLASACHRGAPTTPTGTAPATNDRDHDGIADVRDWCPDEPENINGKDDGDGCPDGRMVVTDTQIEILPAVRFEGLTADVVPEGKKTLDAIAATLDGNPSILVVEVQGFGGDGDPKFQQVIGEQRARAIVDYLIAHGIAPKRLRSRGIAQPPVGSDNRPVFEILQRAE
jgi:OmpA-OmpF porin, OOP family